MELTRRQPPVGRGETAIELSRLARESIVLVHLLQHRAPLEARDEIRWASKHHRRSQRRERVVGFQCHLRPIELSGHARHPPEGTGADSAIPRVRQGAITVQGRREILLREFQPFTGDERVGHRVGEIDLAGVVEEWGRGPDFGSGYHDEGSVRLQQ